MKKFLIVISIVLLVVFLTTMAVGCKKYSVTIEPLDIQAGSKPDMPSAITTAELAIINAGLAVNATEAQKKQAALTLFDVGDRTRRAAPLLLTVSDGSGYAKTGAEGYMTVRGFYFKVGNGYYSQNAGQVTNANLGKIVKDATKTARNMLDQLSRTYTPDMQTFYQSKAAGGEAAKRPDVAAYDDFPYVKADFSGCTNKTFDLEAYKEEARILEVPGELVNFAFTPDAITNTAVAHNEEEGFYRVEFELDISKKGTDAYEDTVRYARDGLREAANSKNLDYVSYKVIVEIWDNGYIRTYYSEENWEATLTVKVLISVDIDGVSDSSNSVSYYWKWEEIQEVISEHDDYEDAETAEELLSILKPAWIG